MQASAPPRGNTRGRDPSQRQTPLPPPHPAPRHTHHSPGRHRQGTKGTAPQATRQRKRGGRAHKGGGREPRPGPGDRAGEGRRHTGPRPHRVTKTSLERRGQAPKPTTNTPHTRLRGHTIHTATAATNTSPTNAHNTPKREHNPHHQTHTTQESPKNKSPATLRQGSCRAARNTTRTQG